MSDRMSTPNRIMMAQDFFRFAYRVGSPISYGIYSDVALPIESWTFGQLSLEAKETELSEEAFQLCGTILERLAYRLLAMELNSALEKKYGDWNRRSNHEDAFIRNASTVVWLIRNSVAHELLEPVWRIDNPQLQHKIFKIDGLLSLNTENLNGQLVRRTDFGGPIALFRLSEKIADLVR